MRVVINTRFGGFGLSDEALEWLRDHEGMELTETDERSKFLGKYYQLEFRDEANRADPRLLRCIEALGVRADGRFANLSIVEIPDGVEWEISEFDGSEHAAEKHRSWR